MAIDVEDERTGDGGVCQIDHLRWSVGLFYWGSYAGRGRVAGRGDIQFQIRVIPIPGLGEYLMSVRGTRRKGISPDLLRSVGQSNGHIESK